MFRVGVRVGLGLLLTACMDLFSIGCTHILFNLYFNFVASTVQISLHCDHPCLEVLCILYQVGQTEILPFVTPEFLSNRHNST